MVSQKQPISSLPLKGQQTTRRYRLHRYSYFVLISEPKLDHPNDNDAAGNPYSSKEEQRVLHSPTSQRPIGQPLTIIDKKPP